MTVASDGIRPPLYGGRSFGLDRSPFVANDYTPGLVVAAADGAIVANGLGAGRRFGTPRIPDRTKPNACPS